ncbi:MAG TPA: 4Fe-4S dicluster domain-containing protein [Desulfosporosinus sp.]
MEISLNTPAATLAEIGTIVDKAHVELHKCYQCGKCTAGCPMADSMDITPREVIRHLQLGLLAEVLRCEAVWVCASCHTCSARCPNEVDVAHLMEVLRQEAKKRNITPVPDVDKFARIFISNIRSFGKSHEVVLCASYNVWSGHLFQDVMTFPHLVMNKLVFFKPHVVKDKTAVRRIMDKALKGADKA